MSENKQEQEDTPSKMRANVFYHPNVHVDEYMYLLTPEENTVLTYAMRRIFGFHKENSYISRSQFETGKKAYDGRMLDNGTGLSKSAIKVALDGLISFGILIEVKKYCPTTNTASCYAIETDDKKINLDSMKNRRQLKMKKDKDRMQKTREKATLSCATGQGETEDTYPVVQDSPILSDKTGAILSDKTGLSCTTDQTCPVVHAPIERKRNIEEKKEERKRERKENLSLEKQQNNNFLYPSKIPNVESPLAMEFRNVCKRGIILSPNDKPKMEQALMMLEAENATVDQMVEFGRKVKLHWIGRDVKTKKPRAPGILQVAEYWHDVLSISEDEIDDESVKSVEKLTREELRELASQF